MSIFGTLLGKIFGHSTSATAEPTNPQIAVPVSEQPAAISEPAAQTGSEQKTVDIKQVLDGLAAQQSQKLNWETSIVDLMKLVDMDSSLHARKELAKELHYSGSTDDTATMNMWLHKEVLKKISENGGKVPAELLD